MERPRGGRRVCRDVTGVDYQPLMQARSSGRRDGRSCRNDGSPDRRGSAPAGPRGADLPRLRTRAAHLCHLADAPSMHPDFGLSTFAVDSIRANIILSDNTMTDLRGGGGGRGEVAQTFLKSFFPKTNEVHLLVFSYQEIIIKFVLNRQLLDQQNKSWQRFVRNVRSLWRSPPYPPIDPQPNAHPRSPLLSLTY